jgi:chromatin modification-related protein VID21
MYVNGEGNAPQPNMTPVSNNTTPQQQQAYAQKMMRMQQMQMQMQQQQSPSQGHANLNGGSPAVAHASPNMNPASPSMQFSNVNQMGAMNSPMGAAAQLNGQQRPNSRSNTPQMQRLGSSGNGVAGMNGNGMQSPGALQGSPRNPQASMAR